jgi:hypothetical protein
MSTAGKTEASRVLTRRTRGADTQGTMVIDIDLRLLLVLT